MGKWHLVQNQPHLREIFKAPPLIIVLGRKIPERYPGQRYTFILRTAGVAQARQHFIYAIDGLCLSDMTIHVDRADGTPGESLVRTMAFCLAGSRGHAGHLMRVS